MRRIFLPLLMFLLTNIITAESNYQETNSGYIDLGSPIEIDLLSPVKFTAQGIQDFLKNVYDNPKYSKEIFPNNMSHFLQFLDFGIKTNQSLEFLEQVIRLFRQTIISAEYVCSQEASRVSEKLVILLDGFEGTSQKSKKDYEKEIKELCYNMFLNDFDRFRTSPDIFLTDLSKEVCNTLKNSGICSSETSTKHIQNLIIRFMESTLSKVLWSVQDGKNAWTEFKTLGESIYSLHERKIICKQDDLNDLVKIVVERFNYFLNIAGADMSSDFYETARKDLVENNLPWLNIEELEKDITTKSESLKKHLVQAQIKAQAKSLYGIVPA